MTLLEALLVAKQMKRPIIYITNNYILGSDKSFSILSSVTLTEPITDLKRPICVELNEVIMTEDKLNKFSSSYPTVFFTYYEQITSGIYINTFNEYKLMTSIIALNRKCNSILDKAVIVSKANNVTKTVEGFDILTSLKAAEGMKLTRYKTDDFLYLISSFISIHPITKTDILNMEIYYVDNRSFLVRYEVIKKKNVVINEFIRYRYL